MPCPLLERYVSFFPDDKHSSFDATDRAFARKLLISDVKAEERNKFKTHRRVWEASNSILYMLYDGHISRVAAESLEGKPFPYVIMEGDPLDMAYLDSWVEFGKRRVHDCIAEHVEFRLSTEAVQHGSEQIVEARRQHMQQETEACLDAVRAVQEYLRTWQALGHACKQAKSVGEHLYGLCARGSITFALQQGRRLLEVRMHDDNSGRHDSTRHQHEPGVREG